MSVVTTKLTAHDRERLEALLAELVAIRSPSGEESEAAEAAAIGFKNFS